jgi:hypothetical protein
MTQYTLRPCVERLMQPNGRLRRCRKEQLRVYRHMLTADCLRCGYSQQKTALRLRRLYGQAWLGVSESVLRQETDRYAGWAFRRDSFRVTCQGIQRKAQHLCDEVKGSGGCAFAEHLRAEANQRRQEQRKDDQFEELGWPEGLRELHEGTGQVAAQCYMALRAKMVTLDLTYEDPIFTSMRQLQSVCAERGVEPALGTVFQAVHLLIDHGLIELVVKGTRGRPGKGERGLASAYRFRLPTPTPPGGQE